MYGTVPYRKCRSDVPLLLPSYLPALLPLSWGKLGQAEQVGQAGASRARWGKLVKMGSLGQALKAGAMKMGRLGTVQYCTVGWAPCKGQKNCPERRQLLTCPRLQYSYSYSSTDNHSQYILVLYFNPVPYSTYYEGTQHIKITHRRTYVRTVLYARMTRYVKYPFRTVYLRYVPRTYYRMWTSVLTST